MKIAFIAALALVASSAWANATPRDATGVTPATSGATWVRAAPDAATQAAPPAATPPAAAPPAAPATPPTPPNPAAPDAAPKTAPESTEPVYVIFTTTRGDIALELLPAVAPISVQNFLAYVDSGFYNGTMFHRSMPNFVIQGGGFDAAFTQKTPRAPIKNEATNGLENKRGSISMARTEHPDSATSQFFLNLKDNRQLDRSNFNAGYAVFGKIVRGEDVMDAIAKIPTTKKTATVLGGTNYLMSDVPTDTVTITNARRATHAEAVASGGAATPAPPAQAAPPSGAAPANPPAGAPK